MHAQCDEVKHHKFRKWLEFGDARPQIYPLELETLDSSPAQIGFNSVQAKLFNPGRKPGHIRLCASETRQGRKIHPGQTKVRRAAAGPGRRRARFF